MYEINLLGGISEVGGEVKAGKIVGWFNAERGCAEVG